MHKRYGLALPAFVVFVWTSAFGQGNDNFEPRFRIGDSVEANYRSPSPYAGGPRGGLIWEQVISEPDATFLRAHLSEDCELAEGDVLVVRDGAGRIVREYAAADVADRWTPTVEGGTVTLELIAGPGSRANGIVVDQVLIGTYPLFADQVTAGGGIISICNTSVPSRIRTADPVTRLTWIDQCGGAFLCSGWLFTPHGHMMTNAHCANSQFEANSLEAWFNYTPTQCDLNFPIPNPDIYDDAITFIQMNCDRDFAVHKVFDPVKGNPADRYGFLRVTPAIPPAGTELWLPQHPGGIRKQISENCNVLSSSVPGFNGCADPPNGCGNMGFPVAAVDLSFNCGIQGGSSGSPVLNTDDRVVALAHAGSQVANYGVRMFNILSMIPNYPIALEVQGPSTIDEGQSAQLTAQALYLNGSSHAVNNFVTWSVMPPNAGNIDQAGLFTANRVLTNTQATLHATYIQNGETVRGQLPITIVDVGVDTPIFNVTLVPNVDPGSLTPGQSFAIDVKVGTDGDTVMDMRLLQLDTSLSEGVIVNSVNWGVNPMFDQGAGSLYQFFQLGNVYTAFYPLPSSIPGFILHLNATPQTIARFNVTFQYDGVFDVFGTPTPPTVDQSVRFLAGFNVITEFSQALSNVEGGSINLTAGTGTVTIVSSDPPNNAIDARQPSNIDGSNPVGWSSIDLTFSGALQSVAPADFSITQSGGMQPPPTVAGVMPLSASVVRVTFSSRINPGAWTTIAHLPSGSSVRLGYLPGDVNGDGTSSPVDILSQINHLNGVPPLFPLWGVDTDRSNMANGADILRTIDLLNGADAFDIWNNVSLP